MRKAEEDAGTSLLKSCLGLHRKAFVVRRNWEWAFHPTD